LQLERIGVEHFFGAWGETYRLSNRFWARNVPWQFPLDILMMMITLKVHILVNVTAGFPSHL